MSQQKLRIGTRGSKLARWQAEWVAVQLRSLGHVVEILEIATSGDAEQIVPVASIGAAGVFTKEIQRALLGGEIDVAVHSLKDLPTEMVEGLVLAAVPERESAADVLVTMSDSRCQIGDIGSGASENDSMLRALCPLLPAAGRVGTGSLRRRAQLLHARPDLRVDDVRGNVDTRLRKLDEGQFDALVLAEAGLRRLGLAGRMSEVLPFSLMLPAVGQGALAIECRAGDTKPQAAVAALDHVATRAAVTAERALLAYLRGGCLAPVGAWGRIDGGQLHLSAVVLSADGVERLDASDQAAPTEAEALGQRVAESLLARGADSLIAASRSA
jgi:hydroxymethylbilane synthase